MQVENPSKLLNNFPTHRIPLPSNNPVAEQGNSISSYVAMIIRGRYLGASEGQKCSKQVW